MIERRRGRHRSWREEDPGRGGERGDELDREERNGDTGGEGRV